MVGKSIHLDIDCKTDYQTSMNKVRSVENEPCLNCGGIINGSFCYQCGQKALDNNDRSMSTLLGGFFTNLFFLDNRFFISLRMLLIRPGTMTIDFLGGQRKKFLPPVTLFLFVNLIYFLLSPLSDYVTGEIHSVLDVMVVART